MPSIMPPGLFGPGLFPPGLLPEGTGGAGGISPAYATIGPAEWLLLQASSPSAVEPEPEEDEETGRFRDDVVIRDVRDRLAATGQFSAVWSGTGPEDLEIGSDRSGIAYVYPTDGDEIDIAQSDDLADLEYTGHFAVVIAVHMADRDARKAELFRLSRVAMNAISGKSLGGCSFPALTILRRGRMMAGVAHPEARITMQGEWRGIVPGFQGHDETDDSLLFFQ